MYPQEMKSFYKMALSTKAQGSPASQVSSADNHCEGSPAALYDYALESLGIFKYWFDLNAAILMSWFSVEQKQEEKFHCQ